MMDATALFAIRDAIVLAAQRDAEAAAEAASRRENTRAWCDVVHARRELAFTVDTLARKAAEAEHRDAARRLSNGQNPPVVA